MFSPVICFDKVLMDVLTNWGRRIRLYQPNGTKLNLITAIRTQVCYPCNNNLCFIKLKQILSYREHNLGIQALGSYFCRLLYAGIYCRPVEANLNVMAALRRDLRSWLK